MQRLNGSVSMDCVGKRSARTMSRRFSLHLSVAILLGSLGCTMVGSSRAKGPACPEDLFMAWLPDETEAVVVSRASVGFRLEWFGDGVCCPIRDVRELDGFSRAIATIHAMVLFPFCVLEIPWCARDQEVVLTVTALWDFSRRPPDEMNSPSNKCGIVLFEHAVSLTTLPLHLGLLDDSHQVDLVTRNARWKASNGRRVLTVRLDRAETGPTLFLFARGHVLFWSLDEASLDVLVGRSTGWPSPGNLAVTSAAFRSLVPRSAVTWGWRQYDSKDARYDDTSPLTGGEATPLGVKSGSHIDDHACAVGLWLSPNQDTLHIRYYSTDPAGIERLRQYLSKPNARTTARRTPDTGDAIEVVASAAGAWILAVIALHLMGIG